MKKLHLFAAAMVLAGAAHAGPIKVVYSETATEYKISGNFVGADLNNDGLLKYNELTSWAISFSPADDLGDLNAFGDYDILNNKWNANATNANDGGKNAFATWGAWSMSVTSEFFTFVTAQVPLPAAPGSLPENPAPVPEPASLALSAIGAAALALRLRRARPRR